jgi:hypothetical protein
MKLVKRTYDFPPGTLARFEKSVTPKERSAVIAGLVQAWLESEQRKNLREAIIDGC